MRKFILLFLFVLMGSVAYTQNKSYTFVFLNNKPDKEVLSKEKSDSIMIGHMNNIGRLAKEGKLLAAGPFEGGGGIFILNTKSVEEANKWLSTDPGVKAKRWNLEVLSYTVNTGGVCPVGEPYEMVFYKFLRFIPEKLTPEVITWHNRAIRKLLEQGSVIHEGTFSDELGGVVVLKADALVDADPAVKGGWIKQEVKKLYIAKGSFCEK